MRMRLMPFLLLIMPLAFGPRVFAADMATKAVVSGPVAYNWTGLYAGANFGYGWGTSTNEYGVGLPGVPDIMLGTDKTSLKGALGGVQLGYNWQIQSVLAGIETDIQLSGIRGDGTFFCAPAACLGIPGISTPHTEKLTWFGTLRGRLGIVSDRWLVYGTGGLAYGHIDSDDTLITPFGTTTFNNSTTRAGWTIGAGVEANLVNNWSWKVEYLFMDFGSVEFRNPLPALGPLPPGSMDIAAVHLRNQVVRFGLNYRL